MDNTIERRAPDEERTLPPILAGAATPAVARRVQEFFSYLASILESWEVAHRLFERLRSHRSGQGFGIVEGVHRLPLAP